MSCSKLISNNKLQKTNITTYATDCRNEGGDIIICI